MKRILERIDQAEKARKGRHSFRFLPRRGEADVPGANQRPISWIRSADLALARLPQTEGVAKEIKYAARDKKQAMQQYDDLANKIVKEGNIKKGSEEDRMVKDLLDRAYTGLSAEKLDRSLSYQGDKKAAKRAAERLRNEIFEPIINRIRGDTELIEIIGKKGYIRGYFPHFMDQLKAKYGKDYLAMARAMLPDRFVSKFLKEREAEDWANNVSIYDVIPAYINSTMRTIYDIPAYNRALRMIRQMPDGPPKDFAAWYADNYMGQPTTKPAYLKNERYNRFSRWLANRYYDNLIGLNYGTWMLNLGQTITNTYPELGGRYTRIGIKRLFNREWRQKFHDSGLLFDYPGMESGILEEGAKRKILHGGMSAGEYINRGVAYLGGLEKAKDMGLVGRAGEMYAMDMVDKTQFAYGKESGMYLLEATALSDPHLKVFQTFVWKEQEFVRNLFSDAIKGGKEERAKLGRFLAINILVPAALAAAGVDVKRYFISITDILPRPLRSAELFAKLNRWVYRVSEGQVKVEDIPMDVVEGIYDAIGPAKNAAKRLAKDLGITKSKKKRK